MNERGSDEGRAKGHATLEAARVAQQEKWQQEEDDDVMDELGRRFEGIKTIGHLVDIGFTKTGDLLFKIRIPYRFKRSAIDLSEAWNIPLDIRMKPWQLYTDLKGEGEDGAGVPNSIAEPTS